jgi:hypothetical protein
MWRSTQRRGFHVEIENIKIHDELHAPNAALAALSKFRLHAALRTHFRHSLQLLAPFGLLPSVHFQAP